MNIISTNVFHSNSKLLKNSVSLINILSERKTFAQKGESYPHVTLSKDGIYDKNDRYNRDFLVKSVDKEYKITKYNDICYNPANLKFGVITINKYGSAIFSPIYITLEISEKYNSDYISYYVTNNNFINRARRYEQGTVYERMAVSVEDFLKLKLKIHSTEHQKSIVSTFKFYENIISAESKILLEYTSIKKHLLQNLFI